MEIENASPELETFVRQMIAVQMARELQTCLISFTDENAVVAVLTEANFGSASIANLMDIACDLARKAVVTAVATVTILFAAQVAYAWAPVAIWGDADTFLSADSEDELARNMGGARSPAVVPV